MKTLAFCFVTISCYFFCTSANGQEIASAPRDLSGPCGDEATWSFSADDQTLTIKGSGEMYDYNSGTVPWKNITTLIRRVIIKKGMTTIGNYAFKGCTNLTEVSIPSSVKSIGHWAFVECTSLASVDISSSVTSIGFSAFNGCSSLESVNMPARLDKIEQYTFSGCMSLSYINIPQSVKSIDTYAFERCVSLESVVIPKGTTTIGASAFEGCSGLRIVAISDTVTFVGDGAFSACDKLTDFFVDSGNSRYSSDNGVLILTKYSQLIQYPCGRKGSCTVPNTVVYIENGAFYQCHGITSVVIPDSVKEIGAHAFEECSNLSSVTILSEDTTISEAAFSSCNKLSEIIFSGGSNNYQVKNGVLYNKEGNGLIQYPCGLNDSFDIPSGVTFVERNAFEGCSNLKHVTIPASVSSVGALAFAKCDNLLSVTIASNGASISINAFKDCNHLTTVEYLSDSDPGVGADPFSSCQALELLCVPSSYSSDTLYGRNDLFRTDSCGAVMDQINECFGVAFREDGSPMLGLRRNVSAIEEERKKCVNPVCESGERKEEGEMCSGDVCVDQEQCKERKWRIEIDTDRFDADETNSTAIVSEISELSGVDPPKISISAKKDEKGQAVGIIVYVSEKKDAEKIRNSINGMEDCKDLFLCRSKEARIVTDELTLSEAPTVCMSLLFIVIMSVLAVNLI